MKRHPLPIRVSMPPASVPGLRETYSRTMLASPSVSRLGSPRYLRSCGTATDAGEGEDAVALADGGVPFDDGVRSDPGVAAQAHVRPDHRVRPDAHAVRQLGEGRHHRGGMHLRSARRAHAEVDLRHHGLAHGDEATEAPAGTARQGRDLEAERVARHDRAPEARPLHAVERDAPVLAGQRRPELGQRLAEQHPRHHRHAREMAREVGLVGAHELGADGPDARLDLDHLVEERIREARASVG